MGISINDLDATVASSTPFEFEYINPAGEETGIFFAVLGKQAPEVEAMRNKMINSRRQKEAAREATKRVGVGKRAADFEPFESDVEFGQKLAATRLVGWRGIDEPFTAELAMRLCARNEHIAAQIMQQSDEMGNFMKR